MKLSPILSPRNIYALQKTKHFLVVKILLKIISGVYPQCAVHIYLGDVKLENKLGRETKQI